MLDIFVIIAQKIYEKQREFKPEAKMSDDRRRIDCLEAIARNSARPVGVHCSRDEAKPTE